MLTAGQIIGAGALSLIGQAFGAGERERVSGIFQQTVWLMLAMGGTLWVLGRLFEESYFQFFTGDPDAQREGLAFFRVYAAVFLFQTFLFGCGACWRAIGDFLRPMGMMALGVGLNLALDPLLIFGWGPVPAYGVAGAAWATVISQLAATP